MSLADVLNQSFSRPLPRAELVAQLEEATVRETQLISARTLFIESRSAASRLPTLGWFSAPLSDAIREVEAMLAGAKYEIEQLNIELSAERRLDSQV